MRKLSLLPVLCLCVVMLTPSCVSKKKFTELMADKDSTAAMLSETKEKVAMLEGNVENLESEKNKMKADFDSEKESLDGKITKLSDDLDTSMEKIAEVEKKVEVKEGEISSLKQNIKSVFDVYAKSGLNLVEKNDMMYVSNMAPITYKSGSVRVNKDQKEALQGMANLLLTNPGLKILVEGHADKVPMKVGAPYSDNTQLSLARAQRVVKELIKLGVDPNQLAAVGRGENMPALSYEVEGEDMSEVYEQNRRTEFIVMADLGELYKFQQSL